MNEEETLTAAERHIKDSLDTIDTLDHQSPTTLTAAVLLTGARICVDLRLTNVESRGNDAPPDEQE
jgi:hypothetical protein